MTTADSGATPPDSGSQAPESPASAAATADPAASELRHDVDPGERVWLEEPNRDITAGLDGASAHNQTVVIEDGVVSKRLRRPMDLVRLLAALLGIAAVAALAFFATNTTSSIGEDLSAASRNLPDLLVLALNVIGGLGLLTLPVAASVDLLVRGRGRQLLDALVGLFVTVVILSAAALAIDLADATQWRVALAGTTNPADSPLIPLFGGLIAFITVARLLARPPWNIIAIVVVVSLAVFTTTAGTTALAGVVLSLLVGWTCGLLTRYVAGTPTTRPSGVLVAQTLERAGIPVAVLRARETTEVGRRYMATQVSGPALDVIVLDRDLEGAGLGQAVWRSLRLREDSGRRGFNMRRTLEQRALLSYAAAAAGAPSPRLLATREVSPDSCLLAYEEAPGHRLSDLPQADITDTVLDNIWRAIGHLRDGGIAHRRLTADNILVHPDESVDLLRLGMGSVAAGDVSLRIDLAEALCTTALLVGPERTVAAARRAVGDEVIAKALPVLQPVALSGATKRAIRKDKHLLVDIRDALIELRPDAQVEHIELERIKPRTIAMIVLGSVAVYLLLSQLAQVDLVGLFRNASWWWVAAAAAAAVATYPGAAWSLSGFVPEKLKMLPTAAAQLAGDFATLVAPPTLGAVAINLRYLQRVGVNPALATASIGVSQVAAFVVHIVLLLSFGVAAGTQSDFTFEPPRGIVLGVAAALIVIVGVALLPPTRRMLWRRVGPMLKQVGPRMLTVAQQPWKILEGVGGIALLNGGYIVCLAACVEAFGGDLNFAAIAVVYLTGSVIGQAAPTPGGLGAVEAAMAAGLTVAGLASGLAFSAVLLYRVITFWLPTIPGYFAFNALQRNGYL